MNIYKIAEIGINHNGDMKIAKKLIDIAKESGWDAVKWDKVYLVIASWVASPFIAGILASLFFYTINKKAK